MLPEVAPELTEWAVYFAVGARRRAAAEAGIRGAASARDADDLIRNSALFLRLVERLLGLHPAPPAPGSRWTTPEAPTTRAPGGNRTPGGDRSPAGRRGPAAGPV